MEKLICSACGAPLTVTTAEPFLTCEYCDTAIENKYYVAPAQPAEPIAEPNAEPAGEEVQQTVQEDESSGGSLLQTLIGVGTTLAANSLRKRARNTTVVRRAQPARPVLRTGHTAVPHRHPEPPRTGGMTARPAHPGMSRTHGGRPSRPAGGRGPGGMRGPGGRHR